MRIVVISSPSVKETALFICDSKNDFKLELVFHNFL